MDLRVSLTPSYYSPAHFRERPDYTLSKYEWRTHPPPSSRWTFNKIEAWLRITTYSVVFTPPRSLPSVSTIALMVDLNCRGVPAIWRCRTCIRLTLSMHILGEEPLRWSLSCSFRGQLHGYSFPNGSFQNVSLLVIGTLQHFHTPKLRHFNPSILP